MEALKSVLLQNEAAAKRCKDHPKDNGCRGINVLKDVTKIGSAVVKTVVKGVVKVAKVTA